MLASLFGPAQQPCAECGTTIQRRTVKETGGCCMPCHRLGAQGRRDRRAFQDAIEDGSFFQIQPDEQRAEPEHSVDLTEPWSVTRDDASLNPVHSVKEALAEEETAERGFLALGRADWHHLVLETNGPYGVVTRYSGPEIGAHLMLYARAASSCDRQVAEDQHVTAGCPCCGVGMGWHASRAHMAKADAIAVFKAAAVHRYDADWYTYGEWQRVSPGRG